MCGEDGGYLEDRISDLKDCQFSTFNKIQGMLEVFLELKLAETVLNTKKLQ